jgi:hypothetical protein
VPHGDVSRLLICATAGAAVAIVAATTVAHVHTILTIELLVITVLLGSARNAQDAVRGRRT